MFLGRRQEIDVSGIFISYRRSDSGKWVDLLHEHLAIRFGESIVQRDLDDIPPAVDFRREIRKLIASSDAVLVIIGPSWLRGDRLRQPSDVLRKEIELALTSRKAVIPVLVGNARMPEPDRLPASIAKLTRREGAVLRDDSWNIDVQTLIEGLRQVVRSRRKPELLRNLHQKLYHYQTRYFELLPRDQRQALALSQAVLRLLDEQAPQYPQDPLLQLMRGYFMKNTYMALRDLRRKKEAKAWLDKAGQLFETLRTENEERLASAYNGLGSVEMLRENPAVSLAWILRALQLVPQYPEALQDLQRVLSFMVPAQS
jgi:tetratricopeptide (TPR) repeat protein